MSSHHFVREDQEPSVIIVDLEPGDDPGNLLEWSPTVVVLEPCISTFLMSGSKADLVICKTSSLQEVMQLFQHQHPVSFLSHPPDEESIVTALQYVLAKKQPHVHLWSSDPGTIQVVEGFSKLLDITIINRFEKWSCVRNIYTKWYSKGSRIKIRGHKEVRINGADKPGTNHDFSTEADALLVIESTEPFWVGEQII